MTFGKKPNRNIQNRIPIFKLTLAAEQDLLNIALFGMERFGVTQSERYRDKLYQRFQELAKNPLHYPAIDYIRQGYRRSVCGSHSIYYRVGTEYIEIMRIVGQENFG